MKDFWQDISPPAPPTPPAVAGAAVGVVVSGTDRNDTIGGSDDDDQIDGRGGDDVLYPYGGNDTVQGGDGRDLVVYGADYADFNISVSALTGRVTLTDTVAGRFGTDVLDGVEQIFFYNELDPFNSYFVPVVAKTPGIAVPSTDGNDDLQGGSGGDSLNGKLGDDRMTGGPGNDLIYDLSGSNTAVYSGRYSDYTLSYFGTAGTVIVSDRVSGRDGSDTLVGINYLQFSDGTRYLWDSIYLNGSTDNDVLNGTGSDNILYGSAGNDAIDGGRGTDAADFGGYYAEYVITGLADGTYVGETDTNNPFVPEEQMMPLVPFGRAKNFQHAGDMALACLARGGVYLAGGIAGKLLDLLPGSGLLAAFNAKAEHAAISARMPVHVATDPRLGLHGAMALAVE